MCFVLRLSVSLSLHVCVCVCFHSLIVVRLLVQQRMYRLNETFNTQHLTHGEWERRRRSVLYVCIFCLYMSNAKVLVVICHNEKNKWLIHTHTHQVDLVQTSLYVCMCTVACFNFYFFSFILHSACTPMLDQKLDAYAALRWYLSRFSWLSFLFCSSFWFPFEFLSLLLISYMCVLVLYNVHISI